MLDDVQTLNDLTTSLTATSRVRVCVCVCVCLDVGPGGPAGAEQQEVTEVVLSPGQSLLLRCSTEGTYPGLGWSGGGAPGSNITVKPIV